MLAEQIDLSDEDFHVDANEGVGIVLNYRDAEVSNSSLDELPLSHGTPILHWRVLQGERRLGCLGWPIIKAGKGV
jgi:hypothetical protein